MSIDRKSRQILVNLGNRYVVFGTQHTLGAQRIFSPQDVDAVLPRVANEFEIAAQRIAETARLSNAELLCDEAAHDPRVDLIFRLNDGTKLLVEVKVRERDPTQRELTDWSKKLTQLSRTFGNDDLVEIWAFNIERLRLEIFWPKGPTFGHVTLLPLDVWSYDHDGTPFMRERIEQRVEDWVKRINDLFFEIENWAKRIAGLRSERVRSVTMSEEMMQSFAVPDQKLTVLDIVRGETTVISIVPFALWTVGYNGRLDVIGPDKQWMLVDDAENFAPPKWHLVDLPTRKLRPFNEAEFRTLVGAQ